MLDTDTPATDPDTSPRFRALLAVEGVETGDGRVFVPGAISWRDLPLPLMATNESDHGAAVVGGATLIGNIDTIERVGNEIHGSGSYLARPGDKARELIDQITDGDLRGISVDVDAVEYEVLFPTDGQKDGDAETDDAGNRYEVYTGGEPVIRVIEGRIMGATVVPFPAFQEAFIEPAADDDTTDNDLDAVEDDPAVIAAAAAIRPLRDAEITGMLSPAPTAATSRPKGLNETTPLTIDADGKIYGYWPKAKGAAPLVAAVEVVDSPPTEWFHTPEPDELTALTITDTGRVHGHIAAWDSCHVGIADRCVRPPRSPSNYARFHVGELLTAEGDRVTVGRVTFGTGHAGMRASGPAAAAHYDDTGTVAADVRAVDGEHGIWISGALRPGLTVAQIRTIMASPPSGDWRAFDRQLDLVGVLCVNVPGFNIARQRNDDHDSQLVASLIIAEPIGVAADCGCHDHSMNRRIVNQIAASVGRTPTARMRELRARVHAGAGR